jgi:hypothetical protein
MAFTEGLLQKVDLLAALQAKRNLETDLESRRQKELQNQLLKQQLEAGDWQLQKEKDQATASVVPDKTAGMLTGEFGNFLNLRQPLSQMPGYVTGTNPAQYQAEQAALRQALAQGSGVQSVGGPTEAETNLMNQQANLAEEQARGAQYQRQGYGSATAENLARDKIEAMGSRGVRGGGGVGAGPMHPNASPAELLGLVKSGNAIQTPEDYSANWQADRDAESAGATANLAAQNYLAGGGESTLKGLSLEDQLKLRMAKGEMGSAKSESTKLEKMGSELYKKAETLANKMYKNPEFIKLGETPQGQALQEKLKAGLLSTIGRAQESGEPFILDEYINQNAAKIYSN